MTILILILVTVVGAAFAVFHRFVGSMIWRLNRSNPLGMWINDGGERAVQDTALVLGIIMAVFGVLLLFILPLW